MVGGGGGARQVPSDLGECGYRRPFLTEVGGHFYREAIIAANTDTAVDDCLAGSGDDTITLAGGTYTLSVSGIGEDASATGDLDITNNLMITGAGGQSGSRRSTTCLWK